MGGSRTTRLFSYEFRVSVATADTAERIAEAEPAESLVDTSDDAALGSPPATTQERVEMDKQDGL